MDDRGCGRHGYHDEIPVSCGHTWAAVVIARFGRSRYVGLRHFAGLGRTKGIIVGREQVTINDATAGA